MKKYKICILSCLFASLLNQCKHIENRKEKLACKSIQKIFYNKNMTSTPKPSNQEVGSLSFTDYCTKIMKSSSYAYNPNEWGSEEKKMAT